MQTLYNLADSNIKKTWILIISLLVLIIFLGWFFSYYFNNINILYFAVFFALFQSFLSYWYSDKIILTITKAIPIEKKDNPELYNIVENLCIASGLPMPKIYILNEMQPNAFATGRDEKHAAIAVTKGLLEKLDKSEIEGVISHELSHIKNRDILLQSVVVVLVGIIAIISDIFTRAMWYRKRDEEEKNASILFFFGIIGMILAPIAAKLIQLAISRKREFLADASGVLITRYPEGLIRALEKISHDQTPLITKNSATLHLFIVSPLKGNEAKNWFLNLFSTHPPIEERIKALKQISI